MRTTIGRIGRTNGRTGAPRTALRAVAASALVLALAGCGIFSGGSGKPDEFVVVEKRPLVVPPDFRLRPPEPGKPSPQDIRPTREALKALFPDSNPDLGLSPGERALLKRVEESVAAPVRADSRSLAADDDTRVVRKGVMVGELLALPPRTLKSDGSSIERVKSQPVAPH